MKKTVITPIENRPITENPFWEDHFNMGIQLSKELFLMTDTFKEDPLRSAYLYNIETGECFSVKLVELAEAPEKNYKFTNLLPARACRICGDTFDEKWSSGGVGAVCEKCSPIKDKIDLVALGIVRNIKAVKSNCTSNGISFTFESSIDGKWYSCSSPCGNWAYVNGWGKEHNVFSVPVGWWELNDLLNKHGNTTVEAKRCHKCENELTIYRLEREGKATTSCTVCGNENTYYFPRQGE
jgi:DNA-directed RNA polymerase subunit M/transcription elongation factor TFIIS